MPRRPPPDTPDESTRVTRLYDARGEPTDDPALAVRGEIVEADAAPGTARRVWFRIEPVELRWLPVSEPAFLLWVLALLVCVWVVAALVLRLY